MAQKDSAQKDSAQKDSAQKDSAQLKITQVRGTVGARWKQRESLRTLGLRKIRQSVIREDNAQTRGLIKVVDHLVEVEDVK